MKRSWWLGLLLLAGAAQAEPRRLAVVVGCNGYEHVKPLEGCVDDAERLAGALRAGGYRVWLMTDRAQDEQGARHRDRLYPDRANLLRQVPLWLAPGSLGAGDTVLFAFSGHGVRNADDGNDYLVPLSARGATPSELVGVPWIYETLRQTAAGTVVVITDACRDVGKGLGERNEFGRATAGALRAMPEGQQYLFLRSCSEGQYSFENEQGGLFTTALVEALTGKVEAPVTAGRVFRFVKDRVVELARQRGHQQTPVYERKGDDPDAVELVQGWQGVEVMPQVPGLLPKEWPAYLAKWTDDMPGRLLYRVSRRDHMPQVYIPDGEFVMGSGEDQGQSNERPQRHVFVSGFWMDAHDVTVGQYRAFCQATGHPPPGDQAEPEAGDLNPVVGVFWYDARAYAEWVGRALPSEAQWERAARGGLECRQYPWGDGWGAERCNNALAMLGHTTPVGSYPPNGLGLFDMAGNVWQWCRDWYAPDWYARMPDRNPENTTTSQARVTRGGSWHMAVPETTLRVAFRGAVSPNERGRTVGFRCVQVP